MPSESKKSKKHKIKEEPGEGVKPLSHYVDDRVELIRQMFSCLKKNEVKNRLPEHLRKKNISRIQQLCLDEVLGISTKRLLSIISNTQCPDQTDSEECSDEEDCVLEKDAHVSLEEITDSEDDLQNEQKIDKTDTTKVGKKKEAKKNLNSTEKDESKSTKEMTMLELLELQARARAIRSQLALEPVTKIELDSEHDAEDENGTEAAMEVPKKPEVLIVKRTIKKILPKAQKPSAPPLKLKRNYKKSVLEDEPSCSKVETKESTANDENRCSSPEIIAMEPNLITLLISDSDDDNEPQKLAPIECKEPVVTSAAEHILEAAIVEEEEEGEIPDDENSQGRSKSANSERFLHSPNQNQMHEDDVVHLMSDTEIEPKENSERDDSDSDEKVNSTAKLQVNKEDVVEKAIKADPNILQMDYDDVVEINNSSDEELMKDIEKNNTVNENNSESWEQRYLSSKNVTNILKTTKLASKVRGKIIQSKKKMTTKSLAGEKKDESDVADSNCTEGTVKQFELLKESSNSSIK